MSAQTARSQYSFALPSLSYINAKWEEPNLSARVEPAKRRDNRLAAWLSQQIVAFAAWRRDHHAAVELASMSDRELMDIGLNRSDLRRVFDPTLNQDLSGRQNPV